MDKYNYEVSCSAPILSPIRVLVADFIGESGALSATFGNPFIHNGMGSGINGIAGSLDNKYCLPKIIEAIWASFVDRKVYCVVAFLPYDEILSLFKKDEEFDHLDLCFLPGGKLKLYVKGHNRKLLLDWEVPAFEEEDDAILRYIYGSFDYKDKYCQNVEDFFEAIYSKASDLEELWYIYMKKNNSIANSLNRYLQRFNYELKFEFEDTMTNSLMVGSKFVNHERYLSTVEYNKEIEMPSRLENIKAVWNTKDFHYTCFMYFNEEEMLDVFDEAYGEDRTQKGELKIKVCKYNNLFDIFLNVGDTSIKLEKTEIRVFQDPIDDPNGAGTLIYKNYDGDHHNHFIDEIEYFDR